MTRGEGETVPLLSVVMLLPGVVPDSRVRDYRGKDVSARYQAASKLRSIQAVFSWICMR